MKKQLLVFLFLCSVSFSVKAQNVGVSFSFFFPAGGEFSMPVSPFSYRGVALPFSDYLGIQTGGSLYRMAGQRITGLPFDSEKSLYGPNLTIYVPLELYLRFASKKSEITFKAGGFGNYAFLTRLDYGNFDRALANYEGWTVANADFNYTKGVGYGWQTGMEILYQVTRQYAITIEVNYLNGGAPIDIDGSYTGGSDVLQTKTASFTSAKVEFTGWEISLGVVF